MKRTFPTAEFQWLPRADNVYTADMKKATTTKAPIHPAILLDLPERLSELEAELRRHEDRSGAERGLKSITQVNVAQIDKRPAIEFVLGGKHYAASHSDMTYSGTNHARGIRHVRFYAEGKMVLEIEGNFEDQQFGSNFQFQNVVVYTAGEWEKDLIKMTDLLRTHAAKRRAAFKKKRDSQPRHHNFFSE